MGAEAPGPVRKRERVRSFVLELIEAGAAGDPLPSERTLCAELDVSRPTLRAAVDELVAAGRLVREPGRGMFIAPAKITQELVGGGNAVRVPRARGSWSGRLLEFTRVAAGARIGRKLRMSPAAEIVYVARLALVDGSPIAIEHMHFPATLAGGLSANELENGELYDHLQGHYGVRVHEAVQTIEPTVVSPKEAAILGVPELSPALFFERLTTDTEGRLVEYTHSVYRGDRYRIVSRLSLGTDQHRPADPEHDSHHPGFPPGGIAGHAPTSAATVGDVQADR